MKDAPSLLRVIHVITSLGTGGAEAQLATLANGMRERGHDLMVVGLVAGGVHAEQLRLMGIRVEELDIRGPISAIRGLVSLIRIFRKRRPDVVQSWLYHADLLSTIACLIVMRIPHAWNLRCAELDPADHSRFLIGMTRFLAILSPIPHAVVTNSQAGRISHELLGYRPRRWEVIPNGIDAVRFQPPVEENTCLRRELRLPEESLLVGLVGRFHPMKDHRNFLAAAAIVRSHRHDVHFILVGSGLDMKNAAITSESSRLALENCVHLLGERRDVTDMNRAFDVAVCASYSEGFPNAIAEAMACGVPCVTTDVGDAAYLVGDTGRIVPPRTPSALASAILNILDMTEESRRYLGNRARRRITSDFSVERLVDRYVALYRELAGRKN